MKKIPGIRRITGGAMGAAAVAAVGLGVLAGPASAAEQSAEAPAPVAVNTVKVTDALLRAEPNSDSTKLDVSQPGRGVDLFCWVAPGPGHVWFRAHPHGSPFTGWMRADLINWATYPAPGPC